ncbi:MAG: AbrB/MazE/SpoVT family DNA-binding domain-containing protein [Thermoplasmata archaeon]|nr:AbrB/MazE/SpoVT family DNA-binding domain-containing protein [Thermoplasmata archaeon]
MPLDVRVFKQGNSFAVIIPKTVRIELGLKLGDSMRLRVESPRALSLTKKP